MRISDWSSDVCSSDLWFAPVGVEPVDRPGFTDQNWKPYVAEEHRAVREGVALIDQSSFSKFELRGPGDLDAIQRLAVSNMAKSAGSVIYTQLCNEDGGIEADLTVKLGRASCREKGGQYV